MCSENDKAIAIYSSDARTVTRNEAIEKLELNAYAYRTAPCTLHTVIHPFIHPFERSRSFIHS